MIKYPSFLSCFWLFFSSYFSCRSFHFPIAIQISVWIFFSSIELCYELQNCINSVNSYFEFRTSDKLSNSICWGHIHKWRPWHCVQTYNDNLYNLHVLFRSLFSFSFSLFFVVVAFVEFRLWIFIQFVSHTLCVQATNTGYAPPIVWWIKMFRWWCVDCLSVALLRQTEISTNW